MRSTRVRTMAVALLVVTTVIACSSSDSSSSGTNNSSDGGNDATAKTQTCGDYGGQCQIKNCLSGYSAVDGFEDCAKSGGSCCVKGPTKLDAGGGDATDSAADVQPPDASSDASND